MNILVIGSGGREHALCWKLNESASCTKLYCAPGNAGIGSVAEIVNILVDEKYLATDGKPDVEKMQLITYEPVHHGYLILGGRVGNAFADGKVLK